jgi:hypothetical protein
MSLEKHEEKEYPQNVEACTMRRSRLWSLEGICHQVPVNFQFEAKFPRRF